MAGRHRRSRCVRVDERMTEVVLAAAGVSTTRIICTRTAPPAQQASEADRAGLRHRLRARVLAHAAGRARHCGKWTRRLQHARRPQDLRRAIEQCRAVMTAVKVLKNKGMGGVRDDEGEQKKATRGKSVGECSCSCSCSGGLRMGLWTYGGSATGCNCLCLGMNADSKD